ncbi:MAG: nicotinate-nucleotide adenylyltransferase [Caulobacteraceae bacterium]
MPAGRISQPHLHLRPGSTVGLFGGTFDPPHAGHLHVARTALRRLGLDRVVWLVSPGNPLKADRADDLDRRVKAARGLARGRRMTVSGAEAVLGTRYTVDTLRALKRRFPHTRFVWIMGADGLRDMIHWKAWREIFHEVPVAVIARPGAAVRSRLSPAAKTFAHARLPSSQSRLLASAEPPAWIYLTAPWNHSSSTALRSRKRASVG